MNADTKILPGSNQVSDKGKDRQNFDHMGNKSKLSKLPVRLVNTAIVNIYGESNLNNITGTPGGVTVSSIRMNRSLKKNNGNNENLKSNDQQLTKSTSVVTTSQPGSTFSNVRGVLPCIGGGVSHENPSKSKEYSSKKFTSELDCKMKNYHVQSDYKDGSVNNQDYKTTRNSTAVNSVPSRFVNQPWMHSLHRENHGTSSSANHFRTASRNDNTAFAVARKALEQQTTMPKMAPVNFPPLRAPQSIVNVRHPFVTEARTKYNDFGGPSAMAKINVASSMQGGIKDHDHSRQTYHSYGTSQIAGIANVPSLSNVTTSMSPYPRPDTYPQPTVASMLFPDTSQFPQSPPFSTTQIGQLNQYPTYDPGSYATTQVNVNPVIPQFSADSSIPYPQYDNSQFLQPNHYPTADIANSQYQYQAAGVGQIQDSPMFIQSLQSPIAVTDQYATPTYARAVRTDLMPRLRRAPRFNK